MEKPLHILLVEDEPGDADLIQDMLSESPSIHFNINWVSRLKEALAWLSKKAFDLVVLDLGLPDSNGLETLYEIRETTPDTAVVVMTGLDDEKTGVTAVQLGAQEYLIKGQMEGYLLSRFLVYAIERKKNEQKIHHLNQVLRTIRDVNQLIVQEKDRDKLLKEACQKLIGTRGYNSAWIALLDEKNKLITTAATGLGDAFTVLKEQMEKVRLNECCRRAMEQPGVVVIEDPEKVCGDCPLKGQESGGNTMTVRLENRGKIFGLLSVNISEEFAIEGEEQELLAEIAGDFAFGLYDIEVGEALAKSEMRYRTLFESAAEGILIADVETRQFLYANPAVCKMLGYTLEELTSMGVADIHPKDSLEHVIFEFEAQARGEKTLASSIPCLRKDETTIYADIVTNRIDIDGETCNVGFFTDITARKQAEEQLTEYSKRLEEMVGERTGELREAQKQLVRKEKLAVLGQLAGGVAHELRNPLGALNNATYFLNMALEEPGPEVKEALAILKKEVETSERIINSLLNLAHPGSPIQCRLNLNDVVHQVLSGFTVPGNIHIICQIDNTLPVVSADPDHLKQIFGNIIRNAIQAMPEGGRLEIEASEVSGTLARSGGIAIAFTDTGVGIEEENLSKLFEPLFTTKAKGIGLGLALVKNLVEANGGSITVKSQKGEGSTFTIALPIPKEAIKDHDQT